MRCLPNLVRQVFLLDLILIDWLDWVGLPDSTCANGCTDGHTVLEIGASWCLRSELSHDCTASTLLTDTSPLSLFYFLNLRYYVI